MAFVEDALKQSSRGARATWRSRGARAVDQQLIRNRAELCWPRPMPSRTRWPRWSGLDDELAPRALSRINAAIRARVSVPVDEDATRVPRTIRLAAVHGVRAEEKHRA